MSAVGLPPLFDLACALLLVRSGSLADVLAVAVLMIAAAALALTVPVTVKVAVAPLGSVKVPVVKFPVVSAPDGAGQVPAHVQLRPAKLKSDGVHVSFIVTPEAVLGPLFLTAMVK